MKDKITVSWGKTSAYNLPPAILIGHLLSQKMFISKAASKIHGKNKSIFRSEVPFKTPSSLHLSRHRPSPSPVPPLRHHGTQTRAAASPRSASRKPNHAGNQRSEACQAPRLAAPRRSRPCPLAVPMAGGGPAPGSPQSGTDLYWGKGKALPAPQAAAGRGKACSFGRSPPDGDTAPARPVPGRAAGSAVGAVLGVHRS